MDNYYEDMSAHAPPLITLIKRPASFGDLLIDQNGIEADLSATIKSDEFGWWVGRTIERNSQ